MVKLPVAQRNRAQEVARPRRTAASAFPVVGVGASAGGLDAFRQVLSRLPADPGLALVLVQHLEAGRESLLSDALSGATGMKVAQAGDGDRVEANRVYVIPPATRMSIENGVLALSPLGGGERRPHLPIDFFLRSLAADQGRKAIGVILSGAASDGTAGLAAIRAAGGVTFAQDPGTARFGEMPQSAVDAGAVDFCLPLPALAAALARLAGLAGLPHPARNGSVPSTAAGVTALGRIISLLRAATGVDFGEHRPTALRLRVARRMRVREARDLPAYLKILEQEPDEVRALHDELLARVTSFTGDPPGVEALRRIAYPRILQGKRRGVPIRAWVVGCGSGEGVYSLAISLVEWLGDRRADHPIRIFGSDLDDRAVERARAGTYSEAGVHGLGEERLQRYFVRFEGGWRVGPAIRELCIFVRHDVGRDPPFSRLDLLSCQGVLGDLGQALQRRVLAVAHHALDENGFLLLGASEGTTGVSRWFSSADKAAGLFRRKPGRSRVRLPRRDGTPGRVQGLPSSEELQSLNEELQTATEELQASNEELTTVNDELQARNLALQVTNADLLNLLDAVEIPIVILDAHRRIRRFTTRASASLGLLPAHVGRRIGEIDLPIRAPDLEGWIARSTRDDVLVEAEVQDRAERWHRLQVRPHRTSVATTGGVILSLVDIDDLRNQVPGARWPRDDMTQAEASP